MRKPPISGILLSAVCAGLVCVSGPLQAQLLPPPGQPLVAPRPPATPSPRAAACHNGASFDRFLAELKQQAVADGVSQRAVAEAAPYLVYDQGIVNRDRGQRVFGQVFTQFAGRNGLLLQFGQEAVEARTVVTGRRTRGRRGRGPGGSSDRLAEWRQ